MAYKMVNATKEMIYESLKTIELRLYVYADYWEMPSAMFSLVKSYKPGTLTPDNYLKIVTDDVKNNRDICEEWDKMLGYPISCMKLGYFDENKDFIICHNF